MITAYVLRSGKNYVGDLNWITADINTARTFSSVQEAEDYWHEHHRGYPTVAKVRVSITLVED